MEEILNTDYRCLSVCVACLSSNRILSPLDEYSSIYHKLFNSFLLSSQDVRLCWECVATLKKIKKFKAKVDEAQKLLLSFYSFGQNSAPRCLSNLGITVLPENTIIKMEEVVELNVIVEETRDKEVKVIKEELDNCSDVDDICAEYSDNLDNDLILLDGVKKEEFESLNEAIKEEIEKVEDRKTYMTLTRKIPSSKLFRPVASKAFSEKRTKYASYDLRNLRKLIPINEKDLRQWIEKQKSEEYYKNLKLKCTTCVQAWTNKPSLTKHMMQYHDKSVGHLVCDVCQCRFRSKAALTKHINKHYFIQQCNICSYQCYTSQGMRWHVTMHKKVVECLQCGASFPSRILFRRHYVATHDVYICDDCGKRCHSKQKLENHIRRKHQTGFRCGECGKQFKRLWSLTEHSRLRHSTRRADEAYCAPCDAQFANVHQYGRHVRRSAAHARERPDTVKAKVPCPSCDRVYCRKTFMMNHYRHVHLNQSKYYCADCDKGFLNSTKFVDHRSYFHEGKVKEKNKLCNICGRGFAATRTLVNHIRTHTGERPYECDYCTAKFTQKHAMMSHVKYIHLKNKRGSSWKQ